MINIDYADTIHSKQVYSAVSMITHHNDTYSQMLLIRWFGGYSDVLLPARGELIGLASINPKYKNENINIAPYQSTCPDHNLTKWRSKYQSLQYSDVDPIIDSLLKAESIIVHDEQERTVLDKIMAKNLPTVLFDKNDRGVSLILGVDAEEFQIDKFLLCLIKQTKHDEFEVIGFRRAISKKHLNEIIQQSNNHNLLLYYSPFVSSGKELVADGPWIMLPASMRNFTPIKHDHVDDELPNTTLTKVTTKTTNTVHQELVIGDDGLHCPYCDKVLKAVFGLTNHVKGKHPTKLEEYNEVYKNR